MQETYLTRRVCLDTGAVTTTTSTYAEVVEAQLTATKLGCMQDELDPRLTLAGNEEKCLSSGPHPSHVVKTLSTLHDCA